MFAMAGFLGNSAAATCPVITPIGTHVGVGEGGEFPPLYSLRNEPATGTLPIVKRDSLPIGGDDSKHVRQNPDHQGPTRFLAIGACHLN